MKDSLDDLKTSINRRTFVKNGLTAAGAATVGAGMLAYSSSLWLTKAQRNEAAV